MYGELAVQKENNSNNKQASLSSLPVSTAISSGSKVVFHNYVELKRKKKAGEQRPRSRHVI